MNLSPHPSTEFVRCKDTEGHPQMSRLPMFITLRLSQAQLSVLNIRFFSVNIQFGSCESACLTWLNEDVQSGVLPEQ